MPKLIQTSGFIKPGGAARYVGYIATRNGVEKWNPDLAPDPEGYLEYMAMRPGAERHGSHGLFSSQPVVDLEAVMNEAEQHGWFSVDNHLLPAPGGCSTSGLRQRRELARELKKTSGKKVYGYLKKPVKKQVDAIVNTLATVPAVAECYEAWNKLRDELESYYRDKPRERLPLSQQTEFKAMSCLRETRPPDC